MRTLVSLFLAAAAAVALDLTNAVVVAPDLQGREKKALELLLDEVQARTQIRWNTAENAGAGPLVCIANGRAGEAEGDRLMVRGTGASALAKNDPGMLTRIDSPTRRGRG